MKTEYIPYSKTGYFSKTVLDYLNESPGLDGLYQSPAHFDSIVAGIENRTLHAENREVLVEVIQEQYGKITATGGSISAKVKANIDSLTSKDTFSVTTGHQLNIFAGPLYTIYKILSIIKLAENLNNFTGSGRHIVPIFWLASEDHDFAEINHLNIGEKSILWDVETSGAVGRMSTKSISKTLGKVISSLGVMPFSEELEKLCREAYEKNETLADATRYFYNALFGNYGLIILDADDKRLKTAFSKVIEADIFSGASYQHVTASNKRLEQGGYKIQVHPREINFFYLLDNFRERIIKDSNGMYGTLNGLYTWTEDALRKEISENAERFSPNVVMRPVYQEFSLPNLAYIGGGAELTYWLSLKSTFEHFKIPFPVVLLRNSALLVDEVSKKRIAHLGFTPGDFFQDPRNLITSYIRRSSSKELDLSPEREVLMKLMEKASEKIGHIDKSLEQSSLAIHTRMQHMLETLEKKMMKAEKNRFDAEMVQIFKVHESLFPNHSLQERQENFLPTYARYGKRFMDELLLGFQIPGTDFTILNLEN